MKFAAQGHYEVWFEVLDHLRIPGGQYWKYRTGYQHRIDLGEGIQPGIFEKSLNWVLGGNERFQQAIPAPAFYQRGIQTLIGARKGNKYGIGWDERVDLAG